MKKLTFALCAVLIAGCNKEPSNDPYWGEATALKNGIAWQAKSYAAFEPSKWGTDYIDIIIRHFDINNNLREGLTFLKVPMKVGVYNVESVNLDDNYIVVGTSYNTFQDDGHILGDSFLIDTTVLENKVEVLTFNKSEGKIEVNFSAIFVISKRQTNESPDTVRFESGYVNTKSR